MYLDTAYVAKYYLNEPDSGAVRAVIARGGPLVSSAWCLAEVICAFHRYVREGRMTLVECQQLAQAFLEDIDSGSWTLIPLSERLLRRGALLVSAAPSNLFLRAGDAVHLVTAQDQGELEIWTNDRHLLAAAPHFGIMGRSV